VVWAMNHYMLNKKQADEFSLAARLSEPRSGRVMEVWSPSPGCTSTRSAPASASVQWEDGLKFSVRK